MMMMMMMMMSEASLVIDMRETGIRRDPDINIYIPYTEPTWADIGHIDCGKRSKFIDISKVYSSRYYVIG